MIAHAPPEVDAVRGVEVEPSRIERELANFWRESGASATRASLINLAIYSEEPEALADNAALLSELTRDHPCRSILISANPADPRRTVRSWINALCHIGTAGGKQVCCEQVVFEVSGPVSQLVPNLLFSHLDSDLPLYFWWQGEFNERIGAGMVKWMDRLIFDSSCWRDATEQHRELLRLAGHLPSRRRLCDLNWTRSLPVRRALAHTFDHPIPAGAAPQIRALRIAHEPSNPMVAKLLAAWIANSLGWTSDGERRFTGPSGDRIEVSLESREGTPISELLIDAGPVEIKIWSEGAEAPIRVAICRNGFCSVTDLMPAGGQHPAALLRAELAAAGRHFAYPRVIETVGAIL